MRVKASKHFRYAGKPYRPGDELDMPDRHGETFVKIRKAVKVEAPAGKPTYKRRDMVAEDPAIRGSSFEHGGKRIAPEDVIDLPNFREKS